MSPYSGFEWKGDRYRCELPNWQFESGRLAAGSGAVDLDCGLESGGSATEIGLSKSHWSSDLKGASDEWLWRFGFLPPEPFVGGKGLREMSLLIIRRRFLSQGMATEALVNIPC
jgi:hypothetical protein